MYEFRDILGRRDNELLLVVEVHVCDLWHDDFLRSSTDNSIYFLGIPPGTSILAHNQKSRLLQEQVGLIKSVKIEHARHALQQHLDRRTGMLRAWVEIVLMSFF